MLDLIARLYEKLHRHRWHLIDVFATTAQTVELDRCRCGQHKTRAS
ncbi:hypothetical protein ACFYUV_04080 [Nonomuraea sp. NPDC003560]